MSEAKLITLIGLTIITVVLLFAYIGVYVLSKAFSKVSGNIEKSSLKDQWYDYDTWISDFSSGEWLSAYPINVVLGNSKIITNTGMELTWSVYNFTYGNDVKVYPVSICPWIHFESAEIHYKTNDVIQNGVNDA